MSKGRAGACSAFNLNVYISVVSRAVVLIDRIETFGLAVARYEVQDMFVQDIFAVGCECGDSFATAE